MVKLKWDKDAYISLPYLLIPVMTEGGGQEYYYSHYLDWKTEAQRAV